MTGILTVTGCGGGSNAEPPKAIAALVVHPSSTTLRAGETVQLRAQANDSMGLPVGESRIMFHADSTSLLRVTETGLVSAIGRAGRDSVYVTTESLRRVVSVVVSAGIPRSIEQVDSISLVGAAGAALSNTVNVVVRDAFGNAIPRTNIEFMAAAGGTASPASTITDATGHARTLWTLGPLAGPQSLRVRADSARTTIDGTARPGPMDRVVDIDPLPTRSTAGDTLAVRLRAVDQFGNGVEGAVFAFRIEKGDGEVTPTRVESDASGIAGVMWRSGSTVGINAMRVDVSHQRDTTLRISRRTVAGAPATITMVRGDGQRVVAGAVVRQSPVVRVSDRYGNPVASARVRFLAPGTGARVVPAELLTDERGMAFPQQWTVGGDAAAQLFAFADGVRDTVRFRAKVVPR